MLIYRLEDINNHRKGIHSTTGINAYEFWGEGYPAGDAYAHPTPYSEGINIQENEYCGFCSLEQMFDWFPANKIAMIPSSKIVVAIYDCPDEYVKVLSKQVVFQIELATPISRQSPQDFLNTYVMAAR